MDPIDKKLVEEQRRQQLEDMAAAEAASTPRPGASARVFAAQQSIQVGPFSVMPFYDVHFEWLQELGHPFATCAVGDTKAFEDFVPRGALAWQLFWLLTTPLEEVEAAMADVPAAKAAARKKFGSHQLGALFEIYRAVVKQFEVYASSVVGYAPAGTEKDKKGAAEAPPSPAAP
jgi:hypothetical protein